MIVLVSYHLKQCRNNTHGLKRSIYFAKSAYKKTRTTRNSF